MSGFAELSISAFTLLVKCGNGRLTDVLVEVTG
jgi:hypothetical protein